MAPTPPRPHFCYSSAGDLTRVTAANANLESVDCAAAASAYSTGYVYDLAHRLIRQTDPAGYERTASYDKNGRTTTTTDEAGQETRLVYDERGQLVERVEPFAAGRSLTSRFAYDGNGNLARLVSPRAYDASADKSSFVDYVESYVYDKLNRLVTTVLPAGPGETQTFVHRSYDAAGDLRWLSLPTSAASPAGVDSGSITQLEYWDTGWIRTSKDPANPRVHFDYTAEGWQASRVVEDDNGVADPATRMLWSYYPDGQLRELKDIGGQGASYAYDADNELVSASDVGGLTVSGQEPLAIAAEWDGLGRLVKTSQSKSGSANSLVTSYGYDLDGNLVDQLSNVELAPDGATVTAGRHQSFGFDQRGLPTSQLDYGLDAGTGDDERIVSTYSPTGFELSRTLSRYSGSAWAVNQATTRSYTLNGLLKTLETRNGGGSLLESHTLSYEDGSGRYLNGNRTHDSYRLVGPDTAAPCRSADCQADWSFDGRERLTRELDGHGSQIAYTLDSAGNVLSEQTTTGGTTTTRAFAYVGQQLRSESTAGTVAKRYFYDRDGRVDCVTSDAGVASDCAAPTGGSVAAALLEDYAYDYRGRLAGYRAYTDGALTDSSSTGYDPLDRPSSETETHGSNSPKTTLFAYVGLTDQLATEEQRQSGSLLASKSYSYDAFGRRIGLTNTPTSGTVQRYSYGYDPHGNVSLLLNTSGTATAAYGYRAYGAADTALTDGPGSADDPLNPYRYSAKRLDAGSATLDMGARRYASTTGRFLQQDLYYHALDNLDLAADSLTASRYNLAGGNPISYVETDGHRFAIDDGGGRPNNELVGGCAGLAGQGARAACYGTTNISLGSGGDPVLEILLTPAGGAKVAKEAAERAVKETADLARPVGAKIATGVKRGFCKIFCAQPQKGKQADRAGRTVVIGRDMPGRVIPYANRNGYDYYKGTPRFVPFRNRRLDLFFNKQWVKKEMHRKSEIVDIGEPRGMPRSSFYEMEQRATHGYPRYREDHQP